MIELRYFFDCVIKYIVKSHFLTANYWHKKWCLIAPRFYTCEGYTAKFPTFPIEKKSGFTDDASATIATSLLRIFKRLFTLQIGTIQLMNSSEGVLF